MPSVFLRRSLSRMHLIGAAIKSLKKMPREWRDSYLKAAASSQYFIGSSRGYVGKTLEWRSK